MKSSENCRFAAGPSSGNGGLGGLLDREPFFGRAEVDVTPPTAAEAAISLQPGSTLSFRLAGPPESSAPVCGAKGTLQLIPVEGWDARINRRLTVRAASSTPLSDLAPARFYVNVKDLPDGCFYTGDPILDLTRSSPSVVELRIEPGATLGGKLVPAQAPVLSLFSSDHETRITIHPDSEGAFVAPGLRPGSYRLVVTSLADWRAPDWQPDFSGAAHVELTPNHTTTLELRVSNRPGAAPMLESQYR